MLHRMIRQIEVSSDRCRCIFVVEVGPQTSKAPPLLAALTMMSLRLLRFLSAALSSEKRLENLVSRLKFSLLMSWRIYWRKNLKRRTGHHRAQQIDRHSALQTSQRENNNRMLFTLTFHPHNHAVKSIILKNFKLLQSDPDTGRIFSQPPFISFKRDKNIRYLHMTHNPLRFGGLTSRRNVWYHDKN